MKVRIHGQTLRFRLDEDEVSALVAKRHIRSSLTIGSAQLAFSIELADQKPDIAMDSGHISLTMPSDWAREWDVNEEVGFEFELHTDTGEGVTVVVEKDYPCAHTTEGKAIYGKPKRIQVGNA
jgi:hypothetical protein